MFCCLMKWLLCSSLVKYLSNIKQLYNTIFCSITNPNTNNQTQHLILYHTNRIWNLSQKLPTSVLIEFSVVLNWLVLINQSVNHFKCTMSSCTRTRLSNQDKRKHNYCYIQTIIAMDSSQYMNCFLIQAHFFKSIQ